MPKHYTPRYGRDLVMEINRPIVVSELADTRMHVPIRSGDTVALLFRDNKPVLFEPVRGKTLAALLIALERGLSRPIPPTHDARVVYNAIGAFLRGGDRERLVKLFEAGKLTARHLLGNYTGFSGGFVRTAGGIWQYGLNS